MKGLPTLLFTALSGACFAQVTTGPQQQEALNDACIVGAYSTIESGPAFELTLSGTETLNGHQRSYTSYLWWSMGENPATGYPTTAQVLLEDYDTTSGGAFLENCYVGDGKTLWVYDTARQTYSASFYSYYGSEPPAGYSGSDATRLLSNLYAVVKGQSAYLVRLLRDINPGIPWIYSDPTTGVKTSYTFDPSYETWAPRYLAWQPPTTPPTLDPIIPSRSYADVGSEIYVLYNNFDFLGRPIADPTRSVAFQLNNSNPEYDPPIWNLTSISFADEGVNRLTNWTMQVTNPASPPTGPQTYPVILPPQKNPVTGAMTPGAFRPWPSFPPAPGYPSIAGYQPISPPKTLTD